MIFIIQENTFGFRAELILLSCPFVDREIQAGGNMFSKYIGGEGELEKGKQLLNKSVGLNTYLSHITILMQTVSAKYIM